LPLIDTDIKKEDKIFHFYYQLLEKFLIFIRENPRNPRLKGFSDNI